MLITISSFSICLVLYALIALYKNICKRIEAFRTQHDDYHHRLEKFNTSLNTLTLQHRVWEEKFKDITDQLLAVGGNTKLLREDLILLMNHTNRLFVEALDMTCGPTSQSAKSQTNWKGQI